MPKWFSKERFRFGTSLGDTELDYVKFNGLLEEILEKYPGISLTTFLQHKLQIPEYKAEELAARIEKEFKPEATSKMKQIKEKRLDAKEQVSVECPSKVNIYSIDSLSGKEFEHFLKWMFEELGYQVQPGKYVADSGVDLVASKDKERIAIQAKRYQRSMKVSNSVILKTHGGMDVYGCERSIVITTSYFTQQAISDARKLNIELWDRDTLAAKIDDINNRTVSLETKPFFPIYKGSLLRSLISLEETGEFIVERKENGKFDLHLPGVKYPLISFQARLNDVTKCVYRIKNNEPVGESEGFPLITSDRNEKYGPDGEQAYELIIKYLGRFLE